MTEREMTLSECVYKLTETHRARREYEELLAENKRLREKMRAIADGCEFPRQVAMYAIQEAE